jgi:hypothetical protein
MISLTWVAGDTIQTRTRQGHRLPFWTEIGRGHPIGATVRAQERTGQPLLEHPSLQHEWLGHCSGDAFIERRSLLVPQAFRGGRSGEDLTL